MLETIKLKSWSVFEKIIKKDLLDETQEVRVGPYFYRGHSDATWHLKTTLERSVEGLTLESYYHMIARIQPEIETFTERKWDLPKYQDYLITLRKYPFRMDEQVKIYMGYLRHFGFPSPLLDWTLSPFVAAYFAFRDVTNTAKSIAIYRFLASTNDKWELPLTDVAQIFPIYSSTQKNKRHHLQQSVYTICLKETNNEIYFANHEEPQLVGDEGGDYIIKYELPASERITALHSLEAYNINVFSLIGSEESLLETLFLNTYKEAMMYENMYSGFPDSRKPDINGFWH